MSVTLKFSVKNKTAAGIEKALRSRAIAFTGAVTKQLKQYWRDEAVKILRSTKNEYVESIGISGSGLQWKLSLKNPRAYFVEVGYKRFDMKPGLLKNAEPIKDPKPGGPTKYKIIPMNLDHGDPSSYTPTFGVVTDQSKPGSWIHPGFKGINLIPRVVQHARKIVVPRTAKRVF